MSKNKNKNVKAAAPTKTTGKSFSDRLSNARGRFIGITTVTSRGETKYNGQFVSQSPEFVTFRDRNMNKTVKLAKKNILSLSGV